MELATNGLLAIPGGGSNGLAVIQPSSTAAVDPGRSVLFGLGSDSHQA